MPEAVEVPWKQWPMPMEEAVEEVIRHMTEDSKVYLANTPSCLLMLLHLSLGMTIRNRLGLWAYYKPNKPACESPDGTSVRIIQATWEALQKDGRYKGVLRDPETGAELPEELRNADYVVFSEYEDAAAHPNGQSSDKPGTSKEESSSE